MQLKVVVLGAGFGGLELSTVLSERLSDRLDLTLIDKSDSFYFGFSKFDVMFGNKSADAVRHYYRNFRKPGVTFRQETITAIDPATKKVRTDRGAYDADVLVIALGADYDIAATPGLAEGGNEFYSFKGAEQLREVLPRFSKGHVVVGVTAVPFKCPPAPSEAALLMHEYLTKRGVRQDCKISLIMPYERPIPPSPETSKAIMDGFRERNIAFITQRRVTAIDPHRSTAILDDGSEIPFDLFLGIPKHVVPQVVAESGLTVNEWVPVDPKNLMTSYPDVYAFGDMINIGIPKAGIFAETAARVAAESIVSRFEHGTDPSPYKGNGTCYVEFGGGLVGRVNVDFFSGPAPSVIFNDPSSTFFTEKQEYGASRSARWFG